MSAFTNTGRSKRDSYGCARDCFRPQATVRNPSFETPAEVRFLSMIGVDAVGMSTVPEVIAARHCGMRVAVVSAITNVSIHATESQLDTTEEEVYENASLLLKNVSQLLRQFIVRLPGISDGA